MCYKFCLALEGLNHRQPTPLVFTTDRSKAVVLVLIVLCVTLWLLAAGHFSSFVLFVVLCCV